MKRIIVLLGLALLVLGACGEADNKDNSANENAGANQNEEANGNEDSKKGSDSDENGYVFKTSNGVSIAMHAEADPILDQLGGSRDYFEAEACAFPGLEKVYTFSGFDLYTYEIDGVDYIASVVFTDDTISTTEGVSLFADASTVFDTYGDDYTENLVSYTYEVGRSQLIFIIEDDEVTSIEYLGTVD